MVKYSFLVAIYNVDKYISRCIDSLLSQDWGGEYEIILVDDGSTDASGRICDEYAAGARRIRVIHQENRGLLLAREAGVRNADGEYLICIDGDDFIESSLLSVVDKWITEYEPDFLMYSMYRDYDGRLEASYVTEQESELLDKKGFLERFVGTGKYNSVCGKVVKKELLTDHIDEIYDRRINISEDKIQTAHLIKYADKILLICDCLYHYCIRGDSIIKKKNKQDIIDVIYAYNRVRNVIGEILENITATEFERKNIEDRYAISTTEGVLEHIYKLNWQDNYSKDEKVDILSGICSNEKEFMERAKPVKGKLKIYNRVRYDLMTSRYYKTLISVDRVLRWVQEIRISLIEIIVLRLG